MLETMVSGIIQNAPQNACCPKQNKNTKLKWYDMPMSTKSKRLPDANESGFE
jgi:hypothetical protein